MARGEFMEDENGKVSIRANIEMALVLAVFVIFWEFSNLEFSNAHMGE